MRRKRFVSSRSRLTREEGKFCAALRHSTTNYLVPDCFQRENYPGPLLEKCNKSIRCWNHLRIVNLPAQCSVAKLDRPPASRYRLSTPLDGSLQRLFVKILAHCFSTVSLISTVTA